MSKLSSDLQLRRSAAKQTHGSEMPRLPLFIALILFATALRAEVDPFADLKKGQPKDVAVVAERIAMCTHFSGEEPYDAARQKEIAAAMRKYKCESLDKDEAALKKRYKNNPAVLDVLQKAHEW